MSSCRQFFSRNDFCFLFVFFLSHADVIEIFNIEFTFWLHIHSIARNIYLFVFWFFVSFVFRCEKKKMPIEIPDFYCKHALAKLVTDNRKLEKQSSSLCHGIRTITLFGWFTMFDCHRRSSSHHQRRLSRRPWCLQSILCLQYKCICIYTEDTLLLSDNAAGILQITISLVWHHNFIRMIYFHLICAQPPPPPSIPLKTKYVYINRSTRTHTHKQIKFINQLKEHKMKILSHVATCAHTK